MSVGRGPMRSTSEMLGRATWRWIAKWLPVLSDEGLLAGEGRFTQAQNYFATEFYKFQIAYFGQSERENVQKRGER